MKKTMRNRKGFTLLETMVTVAIIVMLSSVIIISIGDHIKNARKAATILENNNRTLAAIDNEVYGTPQNYQIPVSADIISRNVSGGGGSAAASYTGAGGAGGSGGSGEASGDPVDMITSEEGASDELITTDEDFSSADGVIPENETDNAASEEENALSEEEIRENAINAVAATINSYATQHNVTYLEGTQDLPRILATAEVTAIELYEQGGYDSPRYIEYTPATGGTRVLTTMEQLNGQNLTRNYLAEAEAQYTATLAENSTGNIRGQIDQNFLTQERETNSNYTTRRCDNNHVIYIGVNRNPDGTLQVVPNICVDTNGNFNTINTFRYNNSTTDRVNVNGNGGWNSYVNFVTDSSGGMLDLSNYTAQSLTSKAEWVTYVNSLRAS
ncbi:MAG: type II secretion system protein [Clostridiales bacterium]|nr:type II secretion system protein [Clostridiales bacterium]